MDRVEALVGFLNRIIDDIVAVANSAINYTAAVIAASLSRVLAGLVAHIASNSYSIAIFLTSIEAYYTAVITAFVAQISAANVLNYISISAKIKIISGVYSSLLDYLNISVLLIVHRLRSTTHYYYRDKMTDIFQRLGVYSVAIGASYGFLPNVFMNARTISLTVSSSQGKSFDIGEIIWLRVLIVLLSRIAVKSKEYARNPAIIFMDIDELVIIPAINAKSGLHLAALTTIDNIGKALTELLRKQEHYADQLNTFVTNLPEQILGKVKPYISDLEKKLDNWITNDYLPRLRDTAAEIVMLQSRQKIVQEQMKVLLGMLGLGGDILYGILALPEPQRAEQLNKVNYVTTKTLTEQVSGWLDEIERHKE